MSKLHLKEIELNFSNVCCAECIICSRPHGYGNKFFMEWDVFTVLVNQLKDIKFDVIQTSGNGEAFLNPFYLDFISVLKREFPSVPRWTYNNFSMLDKARAERIVNENLFDKIHVRIDSLHKWIFERNSNLNQENVFNNLKYFLNINNKIPITILYNHIPDYYKKVNKVLGKRPTRDYFTDEELKQIPHEANDIKKYFQPFSKDVPITICTIGHSLWGERQTSPKDTKSPCPKWNVINNVIWISPNGDCILCCYSKDTEVFTNEGWKLFSDLSGKELILTRKSDGQTEWAKITNQQKYKYKGDLLNFKNRNIDLLVTPDHKFPLLPSTNYESPLARKSEGLKDGYRWVKAQDLKTSAYEIPRFFEWEGDAELTKKYSIHFVKLLGWFLSEGSCCISKEKDNRQKKDGGYNSNIQTKHKIDIYQSSDNAEYEEIKKTIIKCGYHPVKNTRSWRIYNKELCEYFAQFGKQSERFIPHEIKQLPSEYLEALLYVLIKGDGTFYETEMRYYTTSKQLANDVQEIAYKCGYGASIHYQESRVNPFDKDKKVLPQWWVYIFGQNRNGIKLNSVIKDVQKIPYDDYVYDITVEKNHTLWVRRNNKAVWSSNCYDDSQNILKYGNIMEEHIVNLWDGSKRKELLNAIKNREIVDYPCVNPRCCSFGDGGLEVK